MNMINAVAAKCGNENCKCENCTCENCECSQENLCACSERQGEWR